MTDKLENQPEPESVEQLLHDLATPLLITQINADLVAKYLPELITALKNSATNHHLLADEKIIAALTNAPSAIQNNLGKVQKKIRSLCNLLEGDTDEATLSSETVANSPEDIKLPLVTSIKNILLVEDEAVHQDIGKRLLSPQYHVEGANNGVEAIRKCKQKSYDLILMDLQMPKMNGVEATAELRKFIDRATIIIGLTSMPLGEKRTELLDLGFNFFLEKPLKLESLQNILRLHSISD